MKTMRNQLEHTHEECRNPKSKLKIKEDSLLKGHNSFKTTKSQHIPANLPILGSIMRGVNGSGSVPTKNSVLPPPKSKSQVDNQRMDVTTNAGDLTLSTCLNSLKGTT